MSPKSWSGYAPVEATLEMLASALRDVKDRMRQLFAQDRTASNAGLFLDGLLSDEPRKTGWMRSERVGDPGPWRQQDDQPERQFEDRLAVFEHLFFWYPSAIQEQEGRQEEQEEDFRAELNTQVGDKPYEPAQRDLQKRLRNRPRQHLGNGAAYDHGQQEHENDRDGIQWVTIPCYRDRGTGILAATALFEHQGRVERRVGDR